MQLSLGRPPSALLLLGHRWETEPDTIKARRDLLETCSASSPCQSHLLLPPFSAANRVQSLPRRRSPSLALTLSRLRARELSCSMLGPLFCADHIVYTSAAPIASLYYMMLHAASSDARPFLSNPEHIGITPTPTTPLPIPSCSAARFPTLSSAIAFGIPLHMQPHPSPFLLNYPKATPDSPLRLIRPSSSSSPPSSAVSHFACSVSVPRKSIVAAAMQTVESR